MSAHTPSHHPFHSRMLFSISTCCSPPKHLMCNLISSTVCFTNELFIKIYLYQYPNDQIKIKENETFLKPDKSSLWSVFPKLFSVWQREWKGGGREVKGKKRNKWTAMDFIITRPSVYHNIKCSCKPRFVMSSEEKKTLAVFVNWEGSQLNSTVRGNHYFNNSKTSLVQSAPY